MLGFREKNYLKRTDFINSVDSKKIWSKSMSLSEIKELLEYLENEIVKFDFDIDSNFLIDGRRDILKRNIDERLSKVDENTNENILDSLFNFWEFVNNEYYTITIEALQRLNLTKMEMDTMCKKYTESGVICAQEKDIILEMIQTIKNYVDERLK